MSEGIQESIAKAENLLEVKQERLKRLRQKDAFFSQRFCENIQAFAEIMPHIAQAFQQYAPENQNIFLDDEGDLNIDLETGTPLYASDVRASAEKKVDTVLATPNKTVLDIMRSEGHPSRHVYYNNLMMDYASEQVDSLTPLTSIPDFAGSVFFFGVELGYQLELFLARREVKHLYLYEADPDLFFYSLFAIEWRPILEKFNQDGKTINIMIGVDAEHLTQQYMEQLAENGYFMAAMTYLHVAYLSPKIQDALDYFKRHYSAQILGWGFFDDSLMGVAHGLRSIPKAKMACLPADGVQENATSSSLPSWIKDVPVFVLGNGPSLDNAVELIKEVQDRVILICCGTTINTLSRLGIKPDIHVDVERMVHTAQKFEFLDPSYLEDILALTVDVMHPDFFKYFKRTGMGLKPGEAITSLVLAKARESGDLKNYVQMNHGGPIVANLAMSFVQLFGFRNVYFSGVDNGFKDKEVHHSKHSGYYGKDGKETGFQTFQKEKLVPKAGNFGGEVYTTHIMDGSRVQIELILKELNQRKDFTSYNLSDGAYIEGSHPVQPEDVLIMDPVIDKKVVIDKLYDTFFVQPPEKLLEAHPSELIFKEGFDELAQFLQRGWDETIQTREDVCHLFWAQYRILYGLKKTNNPHLYDMFVGSFTYATYAVIQYIFSYQEEAEAVKRAKGLFTIWCDFLQEMIEMVEDVNQFVDGGTDKMRLLYNG